MAQFAPNDNMAEQALPIRPQQDIELQPVPSPSPPQPSSDTLPPADGNGQATKPPSEVNEDLEALAEEFVKTRYKSRDDYNLYPDGWPRLAAEQLCRLNGGFFPRMAYLGNRVLQYQAGRIVQLEQQLHQIDTEEEGHRRDLTDYQKRPAGAAGDPTVPTRYDVLMEESTKTWEKWMSLLLLYRQGGALPKAPKSEVKNNLLSLVKRQIGLSSDAMSFVAFPEDLVCTQADREILPPDWIMQRSCVKFLVRHFARKTPGTHEHDLSTERMERWLKGIMIVTVPLALLVPFAIVYLPSLSKEASFGITVGATTVFNLIIVIFVSQKLSLLTSLGSSCAFLAIMATVVVQLQNGTPEPTIIVVGA